MFTTFLDAVFLVATQFGGAWFGAGITICIAGVTYGVVISFSRLHLGVLTVFLLVRKRIYVQAPREFSRSDVQL